MEFGQSKKVLAVSGDYISLECVLKEAFEIDGEIMICMAILQGMHCIAVEL